MSQETPSLPILAITGSSGSGKTTLIERLIQGVSGRGLRVGAVKRSHHQVDVDTAGKDSHRFREAGANPVALAGDGLFFFTEKTKEIFDPALIERWFAGKADIVIMEGFKSESVPRLQFTDLTHLPEKNDNHTMGFITAETLTDFSHGFGGKPVFHRDDADGIGEWLVESFITRFRKSI
ncbi:MAG: molybdopterin-guanine dinucleotide biosynthesis protein B [Nitrospinae bacterium]|nr:molybdopterin-guanine dinucleotide biosynthesis protein B [Nitrospinota bacterium]MBF0635179.1 molybdopterin-guanine dinucleotide biosynthesis protein B [Nitrospinota bacterium]